MICFRDMAFCAAKCKTVGCPRNFTDSDRDQARKWWSHDPDNVPVAWMDFSKECQDYDPS